MYDEINKKATAEADAFRNSLQYLIDEQNKQNQLSKKLAETNYQNTLNQINQFRVPIEQQYQENARQAYANKMLASRQMSEDLTRLGLDTTGFGMTQRTGIENQYSSNLNSLATDRDAGLRELDLKALDLKGDYDKAMLQADIDYSQRMADLNKYINQQVEAKYQDTYDRFYADYKYQQQLKQQAIKNQQNWYNTYNSRSGSANFNSPTGETKPSNPVQAPDDVTFVRAMGTVTAAKDLGFDITGLPTNQSIQEYKDKKGNIYYLVYSPDDKSYIDITDEFEKFKEKLKKQKQNKNVSKPTVTSNYSKPTLVNKSTIANTKNGTKVNNYVNASLKGTTSNFLKNNSNKMYTGKK